MNFTPIILISGAYSIFNETFPERGVYMASGLYESENFKRPIYIGSSNDLRERIKYTHIPKLNNEDHINRIFQNSWSKYSQESFVWWLLEPTPDGGELEREQYYLDLYRPFADEFGGFNIAKDAKAPTKGRKASEETKLKMKIALTGKKRTEETIQKLRDANKNVSQERRDKISFAKKGEKHHFWKKKFSKEHIEKIIKSKKLSGYIISDETKEKIRKTMTGRTYSQERVLKTVNSYRLINPQGEIVEGRNISELCRKNGLTDSKISQVLSGKRNHHKGWRRADNQ